jgi:hypothetical protein
MKIRRWILALCTVVLAVGFTGGPALADPPKVPCNSGNGNGSEVEPATDCDPGNSGGHNNGKD